MFRRFLATLFNDFYVVVEIFVAMRLSLINNRVGIMVQTAIP